MGDGDSAETSLEQTARHVREGLERIAKQCSLIERLRTAGQMVMLATAEKFLSDMKAFQKLGEEHLARELLKSLPTRSMAT